MGALAFSFVQGPYSSAQQEFWYRWVSLAFLLFGAVIPALVAFKGSRRLIGLQKLLLIWLVVSLLGFCSYVGMSGGGA